MALCKIAKVAIEKATFSFDILFSYEIPYDIIENISIGMRVNVPFGKSNKFKQAMVFEICSQEKTDNIKKIANVIDNEPILNKSQLDMCLFMKKTTLAPLYECVNLLIPAGLKYKRRVYIKLNKPLDKKLETDNRLTILNAVTKNKDSSIEEEIFLKKLNLSPLDKDYCFLLSSEVLIKTGDYVRNIGDLSLKMVRLLSINEPEDKPVIKLTTKQRDVLDFLASSPACVKEVCYYLGVTSSVIDNIVKKGFAEYYELEVLRDPYKNAKKTESLEKVILNKSQQNAFEKIMELKNSHKPEAILLYGITGSGKTAVFLKAIKEVLKNGENAIMMVPEISLTAQTIAKFHNYFGKSVAIMHSGLSASQRVDEWKRIKRGDAKIVIGTRSAIFAPFEKVGIIVIDEEQEHSYKSDKSPRFHARDLAKFRCVKDNGVLIMASATPDIETFYHAQNGKYHLITLHGRYNMANLPETEIIDMRGQKRFSQNGLSDELLFEIEKNIKNNEQTIILNNRRGFNTTVTCKQCGFVEICPNCSIALTYHKPNESLMCHYCGYSKNSVTVCSVCGADTIKYSGSGTQTIENTLNELFPSARILRMDQDTTMAKFSHDKFFKEFSDKKYDILVGTQMVAKGLNFPDVTLVGVLGADKGIFSGDFKGAEKTFSLITQVVGRAGRGEKSGRALIQTTDPDNYVITYGCKQDYNSFYEEEIAVRKLLLYPPFCDICTIGFSAIDENITSKTANSFSNSLKQKVLNKYKNIPIKILGPSKTTIYKINNKYRQKIIIKCKNNHIFKSLIMEVLTEFYSNADFKLKKVSIIVDFSSDLSF